MPRNVIGIDVLKEYILGVMARAEHHAQNVDEICLAVAGAIVWRADRIDVYERLGSMGNALWLQVESKKYLLSFNHNTGAIEVRANSTQGELLTSISNVTTISEVKRFFGSM